MIVGVASLVALSLASTVELTPGIDTGGRWVMFTIGVPLTLDARHD